MILFGVTAGTLFALFIVLAAYDLVGVYSSSAKAVSLRLVEELK